MSRIRLSLLLLVVVLHCIDKNAFARLQYNADEEFVSNAKPWIASDATVFGRSLPMSPISIFLCLVVILRVCTMHSSNKKTLLATHHNDVYAPRENALAFSPRRTRRGSNLCCKGILQLPFAKLCKIKAVISCLTSRHERKDMATERGQETTISGKSNRPPSVVAGIVSRICSVLCWPFIRLNQRRIEFKNSMIRKLNPDATVADLGSNEKPVFNQKLGIWLFPGDDPEMVAKPLAPPPTVATTKSPESKKQDAFAAIMAPPKRGPPLRTGSTPATTGARLQGASTTIKRPLSAGSAAAPPQQYTVFTPHQKEQRPQRASPSMSKRSKTLAKLPPPPPPK